jgi:N-hydroxyarylamine O-acetyltransferase
MAVAGRYNMMILPEIGITFKNCKMEARCSLIEAYCARLRLDDPSVLQPTVETLRLLTERHLEYVPFENISMHLSQKEEPVVLERDKLIHKILVQGRGGCCLELNGLFHLFLKQLGYAVQLVPCWVNAGRERGHKSKKAKFRVQQSHFFLLVSASKKMWMVDVGLGEPPCHPLEYGLNQQTQQTPDGMKSRIVWDPRGPWVDGSTGKTRTCLVLEWWQQGAWEPRLQWDVELDSKRTLESFRHVIGILTHPKSSFARRLIVCKLTRTEKVSMSGHTLKRTSPRFEEASSVYQTLESEQDVHRVLQEEFGICVGDIDWTKSDSSANTKLWEHL